MKVLENIKLAINTLRTNKFRSFLTILGIVIGVFSIILLISIGEGAKSQTLEIFENLGGNTLLIFPTSIETGGDINSIKDQDLMKGGAPQPFTYNDITYLRSLLKEDVLISSMVTGYYDVKYKIFNINGIVNGTDNDGLIINRDTVVAGKLFSDYEIKSKDKVCIVGPKIAKTIAQDYNDALNKTIKIGNYNFKIIGVLKERGYSPNLGDQDLRIIIPLSTSLLLKGDQSLNLLIAQVKDSQNLELYKQKIIFLLKQKRGKMNFVIAKQEDLLSAMNDVLNILTLTLAGIAGISLIVGGIGIMNIMLVSVTERYKEIGIRKAVGARKKDLLYQFLTESATLSLMGGGIGILLSFISGKIVEHFKIPFSLNISTVVLGFIFSLSIGLIFGILPAVRASNLDPIQALRSE
ncbi:MAG TPA: ABC transporter permease [Dictyoglomaceae bacterium]|nr:ABC transporter permease [Dictyoglomaceae bacterium]HOL39018.1 ABC transporter permease [Dictyoglomaceae bacterium]HPP15806.1 ABC transporter permease [Dictyoglomaceae bacterium]